MPAPSTVIHSPAARTALATATKTQAETGAGTMAAELYDDDDLLLVSFDIATFGAVSGPTFSADENPLPETTAEMFGAGAKTPTYAVVKNKDGDEVWRTPTVTTTPASFEEGVPVKLTGLSYTASV